MDWTSLFFNLCNTEKVVDSLDLKEKTSFHGALAFIFVSQKKLSLEFSGSRWSFCVVKRISHALNYELSFVSQKKLKIHSFNGSWIYFSIAEKSSIHWTMELFLHRKKKKLLIYWNFNLFLFYKKKFIK